jgi:hypothetical protein
LRYLQADPRLLQRVQPAVGRGKSFDGGDRATLHSTGGRDAGTGRLSVHMHRAGATQADAAAVPGAALSQAFAQRPQQGFAG